MVDGNGFSETQIKSIVYAILAGADKRGATQGEIVQIANMLWGHYVAGQMVDLVLDGELKVSLADGELAFQLMEDGAQ